MNIWAVMIWELTRDTADAELLGVAYRSLHEPLERTNPERACAQTAFGSCQCAGRGEVAGLYS